MQESYFIAGYFLLGSVAGVFAGLLGVGGGADYRAGADIPLHTAGL